MNSDFILGLCIGSMTTYALTRPTVRKLIHQVVLWRSTAETSLIHLSNVTAQADHILEYHAFLYDTLYRAQAIAESFGGNDAIAYILGEIESWERANPYPSFTHAEDSPPDA